MAEIIALITAARTLASTRPSQKDGQGNILLNAGLTPDLIDQAVNLDEKGKALIKPAAEKQNHSARGYHLRVARTIADLAGDETTRHDHLAEALQYRRTPENLN